MITEKDVLKALERVIGPDQTPLSQSSSLGGISINDGKIYVTIAIDPSQAAKYEPMRRSAEGALKALPGGYQAFVTLTAEARQGTGGHAHAGHSHAAASAAPIGPKATAARAGTAIEGVKHIIAVASGKGGVGKSTTAANLALGLAATGWKVGVLDADIYGPSMPRIFGVSGKPDLIDNRIMKPHEAYGLKVMSIGFLVEEETAMIWRGPMVMSAITQMLREVAWGELDVLVVDMPPGTGDAQLTMAQAVPLSGAVIVSTPQDLALIDARRGISMFKRVNVPILGLVENMSYFVCPHCHTRSDIFAHGGARHEAERLNVPFLGEVPLEMAIRETSDSGKPLMATAPQGPHAKSYLQIAQNVRAQLEGKPLRAAPRISVE